MIVKIENTLRLQRRNAYDRQRMGKRWRGSAARQEPGGICYETLPPGSDLRPNRTSDHSPTASSNRQFQGRRHRMQVIFNEKRKATLSGALMVMFPSAAW